MAYQAAVTSNITRNTVTAQGISLDHSIFVDSHNYFPERVRSYGSYTEFLEDTSIPSTSNTAKAITSAFSANTSAAPSRVYAGRIETDNVIITPNAAVIGSTYGFTVKVYDATRTLLTTTIASFTATTTDVADVVTGLSTSLGTVTGVTSSIVGTTITLAPASTYSIVVTAFVKVADTYTSTETPAEILAAIQEENNEWYALMAADHTETFQLAMAAAIQPTGASDSPKMYWTSTSDVDSYVAVVDPAVDVIGKLKEFNYTRTVTDWSHLADSIFPEMLAFNYASTFQAGAANFKFNRIAAYPAAANPSTGARLSTGMQGNINARNGNWMGRQRGVDFYQDGKVASGEWIDIIMGVDWLNDRIEVEVLNVFLNQQGGKVSYAKPSIIKSTIDSVLQQAYDIGFLDGYVGAEIPDYLTQIPFSDKVERILKDVKWTGYLSGAVNNVIINGNLTYQQAV